MPRVNRPLRPRAIISALITLECVLLLACALATAGAAAVGLAPFAITSGSMEPTIGVGALVWARQEPGPWEPGDVCAFATPDGTTVVHRVVAIEDETGALITKGDANAAADASPVPLSAVRGKVVGAVPVLGALFLAAQAHRPFLIALIIGINGALAAAAAAVSKYQSLKGEEHGETTEEADGKAKVPERFGEGGGNSHRLRPHFRRGRHGLLHR